MVIDDEMPVAACDGDVVEQIPVGPDVPALESAVPEETSGEAVPLEVAAATSSPEPPVQAPTKPEPPMEADPTPQELMDRALGFAGATAPWQSTTTAAAAPVPMPTTAVSAPENKAAVRFKKWGLATVIVFAVSNALGLMGVIPAGVAGILLSFVMAIVVAVFGVQALVHKVKNRR